MELKYYADYEKSDLKYSDVYHWVIIPTSQDPYEMLEETFENIKKSLLIFNNTLKQQEKIIQLIPKTDAKLNTMKIIVALNVGLIIGLIIGKYFI